MGTSVCVENARAAVAIEAGVATAEWAKELDCGRGAIGEIRAWTREHPASALLPMATRGSNARFDTRDRHALERRVVHFIATACVRREATREGEADEKPNERLEAESNDRVSE